MARDALANPVLYVPRAKSGKPRPRKRAMLEASAFRRDISIATAVQ
jgi:hypothetical protein